MYKTALQVRDAEVRGVLAAFVDAGLVKVAGQQDFDNLAEVVADTLGTSDYDLQKIANVTDYVLSGNQSVGFRKTAAEQHDIATKAALGELLMMKTANQIDETTFVQTASELMKIATRGFKVRRGTPEVLVPDEWHQAMGESPYWKGGRNGPSQHPTGGYNFRGNVTDAEAAAHEAKVREYLANNNGQADKAFDEKFKQVGEQRKADHARNIRNRRLRRIGIGGAGVAGLAGAGLLGKYLYDKYAA